MSGLKPTYQIIYACDNNFVALLAASIKSLEVNSPGSVKLIYIIDDGISSSNKRKLIQSFTTEEIGLQFIPHKKIIGSGLNIPYFNNSQLPLTAFFRLFIAHVLPLKTEKALYLDCDTIVLGDISGLWETDISNHIIAAVQDLNIKRFDCDWGGVRNYADLGYPGDTPYFNSGVLLFNVPKWIAFKGLEKTLAAASQHKQHILYADQYCLNVVLANNWLMLDPLWNHLVDYCLIDKSYHPDPFILHFTGIKPIYTNYSYSEEYKAIFLKYLQMTSWKNTRPAGRFKRKLASLKRVLRKLLS